MAPGRNQARSRGQVDIALFANRILRTITIRIVVRVVEQRIHGLVTLKIDDAYCVALPDFKEKRVSGLYDKAVQGVFG
jgi:hypothetical protein